MLHTKPVSCAVGEGGQRLGALEESGRTEQNSVDLVTCDSMGEEF